MNIEAWVGNAEAVAAVARRELADYLTTSGWILYSSADTLCPGPVYLGNNPGGDVSKHSLPTIGACIAQLPSWTQNAYLDEGWARRNQARAQNPAPMQLRVAWLLTQLGLDTRNVCASNVVFARSVTAAGINFRDWADRCWPVHQQIMEFVSPALVVVFGGEPYEYVRQKLRANPAEGICAGHGNWMCRASRTDGGLAIIGLPHLSRYEIRGKSDVVAWIKRICHAFA